MSGVPPVESAATDAGLIGSLRAGAAELGVELPETDLGRMIAYVRELARWNRAYNLTAVRDVEEMVPRHLLDSLAVHGFVAGSQVVDAGTGAGLPGIPLAIALPASRFTLIDAGAKKVRFLRHVTSLLSLSQTAVVQSRLQDYRPEAAFDTVIARALAPLPRLLDVIGHLCAPGGRLLAMQGRRQDAELAALPAPWEVDRVERLSVPGLHAQRHVVILRRAPVA
jgi:16S rRNA (guanine527-N7)-methyltransferase